MMSYNHEKQDYNNDYYQHTATGSFPVFIAISASLAIFGIVLAIYLAPNPKAARPMPAAIKLLD